MSSYEERVVALRQRYAPAYYAHDCSECGLPGATAEGTRCASCMAWVLDAMTPEEILALMPIAASGDAA